MKISELLENKDLNEGFSRMLDQAKHGDFAILTAYKVFDNDNNKIPKEVNVQRNRELRSDLDAARLGTHPLVGHWRECIDPNMQYDQCPANKLVDAVERSYFVPRNAAVNPEKFKQMILSLAAKYNQNAVVLKSGTDVKLVEPSGNEIVNLGSHATVGKISQGYSQYVRNLKTPFIFEAEEDYWNNKKVLYMCEVQSDGTYKHISTKIVDKD